MDETSGFGIGKAAASARPTTMEGFQSYTNSESKMPESLANSPSNKSLKGMGSPKSMNSPSNFSVGFNDEIPTNRNAAFASFKVGYV